MSRPSPHRPGRSSGLFLLPDEKTRYSSPGSHLFSYSKNSGPVHTVGKPPCLPCSVLRAAHSPRGSTSTSRPVPHLLRSSLGARKGPYTSHRIYMHTTATRLLRSRAVWLSLSCRQ